MSNHLYGKDGYGLHNLNPLINIKGYPVRAGMINALFGFKKVPADFSGTTFYNCHKIHCLVSQPNRKHRMMTHCPVCQKWVTVGCLNQHMKIHR